MSDLIFSWSFNTKKQRSSMWYIIFASIAIWFIIWWFLNKMYGLSFVIIILAWLMYFIENNSPDTIQVNITDMWIQVWNNFYSFWEINSFTMIYENTAPYILRLNLNKSRLKQLDLYINKDVAKDIKDILSNFIEENGKAELTFSEKIIKLLNL